MANPVKYGVSIFDLVRHWGVSRTRVREFISEGCPRDSYEAADAWRENRVLKRLPTNQPANLQDEPLAKGKKQKTRKPARTSDSLHDALQNAIKVSEGAFEDYENARVNKLATRSIRLAEHSRAVDMRLKAEKAYREELERRKLLVPIQDAIDMCRRTMDPVLRRLKKIPQEVGPQCNPQEALKAVSILELEINNVISIGRKALDAIQPQRD